MAHCAHLEQAVGECRYLKGNDWGLHRFQQEHDREPRDPQAFQEGHGRDPRKPYTLQGIQQGKDPRDPRSFKQKNDRDPRNIKKV